MSVGTSQVMANAATPAKKVRDPRTGLRTSATLATVFTVLGHFFFGFEQSWAQVFVALVTGYSAAILFEFVDASANARKPGYLGGGFKGLVNFLLSAHMTSITLAFLLYTGERLMIIALAVIIAIGSKYLLRVRVSGRLRHFMNPSNFAIAVVLLTFQWTGIIPWGYTAELHGWQDFAVPMVIVLLGSRLNILFTGRVPTILAWLVTFVGLGVARALYSGGPVAAELVPMTGIPLVLFTFYMITDPQTSPTRMRSQILFGGGMAVAYSVLLLLHVQYTMFYAVAAIAALRGCWLLAESYGLVPSQDLKAAPVVQGAMGQPQSAR